ncbi:mitotic spindle assembly checkpoint protein MAD2B-like [Photinus pyralis]|uniref:mitotic spindle assembly checkpoint protein MAD2B-like n=1 Tax=Photinus pyralis TaxID=7054 RepID=UPI00126769CD|nr:mitotic spindle assembly checkpoint protein MAD2B-like [Photinus pyralis]XP_031344771.1 mitotic spindle assembly checkpoint protein MAD2B-like [Photinus pyralis]
MNSKADEIIVNILCEFCEVVIHNILYLRQLYPKQIFVKRKKYGVIVHRSVHPQLNEYITESLKAVKYHAKACSLRKLFVCIIGAEATIHERFVFDILSIQNNFNKDQIYLKLEQDLRDFCLKLQTACSYLDPVPDNAVFKIMLHTTEYSNISFNSNSAYEDFPWLQVKEQEFKISAPDVVPLHTVKTDSLGLQIYIEKNSL